MDRFRTGRVKDEEATRSERVVVLLGAAAASFHRPPPSSSVQTFGITGVVGVVIDKTLASLLPFRGCRLPRRPLFLLLWWLFETNPQNELPDD